MNVSVVFFIKGRTEQMVYGLKSAERFIQSYNKYEAGIPHTLIFAVNGWEDMQDDYEKLKLIASSNNAKIIELPNEGLDLGVYFRAAALIDSEYVLFLNSNCEIVKSDYLKNFYEIISRPEVGLVGPTGSWETPILTIMDIMLAYLKYFALQYLGFKKIRRYKGYEKIYGQAIKNGEFAFARYRSLKKIKFPNFHIRTGAIMVKRKIFLDYAKTVNFPKDKNDTYEIEHGENSLTKYIMSIGMEALVVGANGEAYAPKDWHKSKTYRMNGQSNLMIADKHPREYAEADLNKKIRLERSTWGTQI